MSRSSFFVVLLIGIALALTATACTPAAAPVAPTSAPATAAVAPPTATAIPATPTPTATAIPATPIPTATAIPATPTATTQPTATAAAAAAYPLTLKDDLGREVKIAARPARIVSLAPSITEVLFAVGAGEQVVGVTKYCNYPPEAAQGREIVGGFSAKSLSVEKIISLKPDLVFAAGATHKPVSEALEAAGVPVFNFEPKDFTGVYANILAAGALTGHTPQAEKVVADMKARVAKVTAITAAIPQEQRVKVFYEVWDEPLMTAGPATFIGQVIELAGGVNIFADVKEQYPTVSAEAVVSRNPQVILGPSSHGEGLTAAKIAGRPGWGELAAVKAGRIVIVDGDIISRPGPRLADALEAVARGLYPERFK
ncbi:MAG: ABC transporter substrate-binding protein [Anaerolineae bacterium]